MARRYIIEIGNQNEWDNVKFYIESLKSYRYGIASRNVNISDGTIYVQLYVCFKNPIKLSLSRLGCFVSVSKCRSHDESLKLIRDGEVMYEFGVSPHQGKKLSHQESIQPIIEVKSVNVYWLCGLNKIAIKRRVSEIITSIRDNDESEMNDNSFDVIRYDVVNSCWVNVSSTSPIAIYYDFNGECDPIQLHQLTDTHQHQLRTVDGGVMNNYKTIIITSRSSINRIYANRCKSLRDEWSKRFIVERFNVCVNG